MANTQHRNAPQGQHRPDASRLVRTAAGSNIHLSGFGHNHYDSRNSRGPLADDFSVLSRYLTQQLNIILDSLQPIGIFNTVVNQQKVTAVFAALADPTRRSILERLSAQGESRVTALAKPFHMSLPAISRHLRVLEKARLIRRQRHGREHLIRANTEGVKAARQWMAHYAAGWDFSFDALDDLLRAEQRKEGKV